MQTVDELMRNLQKPGYVLTMANADQRTNSGAQTRAKNARKQIRQIIVDYCIHNGLIETSDIIAKDYINFDEG